MAAPAVVRSSGPPLCPSFAEVCSFLERYGAALDLPEMTFPQMERYLRDTAAGERLAEVAGKKAATLAGGASSPTIIVVMMRSGMENVAFCDPHFEADPLIYR